MRTLLSLTFLTSAFCLARGAFTKLTGDTCKSHAGFDLCNDEWGACWSSLVTLNYLELIYPVSSFRRYWNGKPDLLSDAWDRKWYFVGHNMDLEWSSEQCEIMYYLTSRGTGQIH